MIVFDLKCQPGGHVFEAWFGSTEDYEDQRGRGLVACPLCDSAEVEKAVMAPRVSAKGNRDIQPPPPPQGQMHVAAPPEEVKAVLTALAAMQKKIIEQSDYVGERFADEARAIHLGEADARSIYGKATREETESLLEEGIAVAPLPFPVVQPDEQN